MKKTSKNFIKNLIIICFFIGLIITSFRITYARSFPVTVTNGKSIASDVFIPDFFTVTADNPNIIAIKQTSKGYEIAGLKKGNTFVSFCLFGIELYQKEVWVEEPYVLQDIITANVGDEFEITIKGTRSIPRWEYDTQFCEYTVHRRSLHGIAGTEISTQTVKAIVNGECLPIKIVIENPVITGTSEKEAYESHIVKVNGTISNVSWFCNDPSVTLKPSKNTRECQIYSEKEGTVTVDCAVNGRIFPVTIFFSSHSHVAEWIVSQKATCTNDGLRQKFCKKCGQIIEKQTIQYTEYVKSKIQKRSGMYGQLDIPDVNHSVALFKVGMYESPHNQKVVDAEDSAAYMPGQGFVLIGDHNTQGFEKMKSCQKGSKAYITTADSVRIYTCKKIGIGKNIDSDLVDQCGKSLLHASSGTIIMYTCNPDGTVTYSCWN